MAHGRSRRTDRRRQTAATRAHETTTPVAWPTWAVGLALFGLALLLRVLYGSATPDARWAYSAAFKGDALVWLDFARALHIGQAFDLGLPIHPPGNAWLIAALWDGRPTGIPVLRIWWDILGALGAALVYAAARAGCGPRPALIAGLWTAAAAGPLILSSSLNNEAPYLVLAAASLWPLERLRQRPQALLLAAWGALQGLACLFRVEHLLFALAAGVWLAWRWRHNAAAASARAWAARLAGPAAAAALVLLPWQIHVGRVLERFNTVPPPAGAAEQAARRQVAARLAHVSWDVGAVRRREALPAFTREASALFVAATVAHRGRQTVQAGDFALLEEAFGSLPRPLGRFPFVSLYGPLNFALANHAGADGGFSPALLEQPPRAALNPGAFPPDLLAGLPPPQLALLYPPHLELVNDGYALGLRFIAAHPLDFARLAGRKLRLFWAGAALGLTGYNLPLSPSGVRRAVDLVTPRESWLTGAWQLALLGLVLAGARAAVRHPGAQPWLLFLAGKVVVTVAFFGYARQGAVAAPALALVAALAFERPLARIKERHFASAVLAVALLLVAVEAARARHPPQIHLDGRPIQSSIQSGDPLPPDHHGGVRYEAQ